jgi:hypothetical protein
MNRRGLRLLLHLHIWWVDVGLKDLGAARDDERDGLDVLIIDGLERACHLVFMDVDTSFGHESETSLGICGLVFGEVFKLVVFIFKVTDVAIAVDISTRSKDVRDLPFACEVQDLVAIIPEWHTHTRDGIEDLEATHWFRRVSEIPKAELTVAHP